MLVALIAGAVIFVFGMIVARYETPPWESVRFLVEPELEPEEVATPPKEEYASPGNRGPDSLPQVLRSTLLNFDIHWVNPGQLVVGAGGGLAIAGDKILINRDLLGAVWIFDASSESFYQSSIYLPESGYEPKVAPVLTKPEVFPPRYTSVLVSQDDEGEVLFSFYGFLYPEKQCRTVRLAMTRLPSGWDEPATAVSKLDWRLLFEASPCISYAPGDPIPTSAQEGGFLGLDANGDILFSTGDMGMDGTPPRPQVLTQPTPESDYGRVFRYSLKAGTLNELAVGLRNPQGVALDSDGNVWMTDQGPMGGDEVNLLRAGTNYGWPLVTLGADYTALEADARGWPAMEALGHHDGFTPPKLAFVPSVSPSAITHISSVHPHWDGDLLVSTLVGGSLVRILREGAALIGQETLNFNERMRGVVSAHGRIYFLTDLGMLGYLTPRVPRPQSPERQRALGILVAAGCIECHSKPALPSLFGVYGAPIARQTGVTYSTALSNRNDEWTEERLREFLQDPASFAPGTTMPSTGLSGDNLDRIVESLRNLAAAE